MPKNKMSSKALAFAKDQNMFKILKDHFNIIGIVGDSISALLIYLVMASCRFQNPVSLITLGSSSGGKSYSTDRVGKLFPKRWKDRVSALSPKVLSKHSKFHFRHKIFILDEMEGKESEAQYILRILQSAGKYTYRVTGKDKTVKEETILGPIVLIDTTSEDPEGIKEDNLNRCFLLEIDQSKSQTKKILKHISEQEQDLNCQIAKVYKNDELKALNITPSDNEVIKLHKSFLKNLKMYPIVIPYAELIIPKFLYLNARRDFSKFNTLIRVICHLRQYQKTIITENNVVYLEADLKDYEIAYPLIERALQSTIDKNAALFEIHKRLIAKINFDKEFNRRKFQEITGLGDFKAKQVIKQLVSNEFILLKKASVSNKPAVYELNKEIPQSSNILVTPTELAVKIPRKNAKKAKT